MPDGYRFRTGWRGRLILQRRFRYLSGPYGDTAIGWRDATAKDLTHFFTNQES